MLLAEAGYDHETHEARLAKIKALALPIEQAIPALVGLYEDLYGTDAEEINHGMCEDFAADLCSLFPGVQAYWDDEIGNHDPELGSHKMVKYGELWYDSQCPEGTTDWRTLLR